MLLAILLSGSLELCGCLKKDRVPSPISFLLRSPCSLFTYGYRASLNHSTAVHETDPPQASYFITCLPLSLLGLPFCCARLNLSSKPAVYSYLARVRAPTRMPHQTYVPFSRNAHPFTHFSFRTDTKVTSLGRPCLSP